MSKPLRRRSTLQGFASPVGPDPAEILSVIQQALVEVTTPTNAAAIMDAALSTSAHGDLPEEAEALALFVFGGLRDALDAHLGQRACDSIMLRVAPLLGGYAGGKEPRTVSGFAPADERESAPPVEQRPRVVLIDADAKRRNAAADLLRSVGYESYPTPNAGVAMAVCIRVQPKLVVASEDHAQRFGALTKMAFGNDAPTIALLPKSAEPYRAATELLQLVKRSFE